MLDKITQSDLIFFQLMSNPISASELLFHDFDNLGSFDNSKSGKIRMYQHNMLAFDSLFFENPKLSKKENFTIKQGMAESYNLGGRLTGKSLVSIIIDSLCAIFNKTFNWGVVSSLDALHIRGIMEKVILALENHEILKNLNAKILRSPNYKITTDNGCLFESVNDNILGKNSGSQHYGKHYDKHWKEESSFLTQEVSNKQLMASSELGVINRFSGMTTFSKHSPMGKIFYDLKNKSKIINLSSYVNPAWDKEKDEAAILEFGGLSSVGYKVQVKGEIVEDGGSVFDISRIRECYDLKNPIKNFEINRNNFFRFKEIIIIDKPNNVDKIILASDIGEGSAPTEIIIMGKVGDKYVYLYNITTMKLSADEEYEVQDYIIQLLGANVIAIDVTSGGGKAVASKLTKKYPENIVWVSFNEKLAIDFEKDDKGALICDKNGTPQYKEEYITDWSIQRIKHLFYNKLMVILIDYKLDQQFSNLTAMKSGMRTVYGCKIANHLLQAFQVFSIAEWKTEFANIKPIQKRQMSFGVFN